jgi:hypothetical protein
MCVPSPSNVPVNGARGSLIRKGDGQHPVTHVRLEAMTSRTDTCSRANGPPIPGRLNRTLSRGKEFSIYARNCHLFMVIVRYVIGAIITLYIYIYIYISDFAFIYYVVVP